MTFDVELLEITKNNMAEAQFMAANFINKKLRNRIFFNAIAAESVINYIGKLGIDISNLANIHSIKRIVEKIDISDIILSNIHIDVRVAFDKAGVYIPKSHSALSIVPDIYAVLKYDNNFEKINLIGFFNPSEVQLHSANAEYYFVDAEQFKSPFEMLNYINNYDSSTEKNISQEEMLKGRELSIKVADHDISDSEFKDFMQLLVKSSTLRASVLEYDNFETLASNVAIALRINKKEQNEMQNSVVDFDDFIGMNESNEENNSDTENETAEDFNGDSMLEDDITDELTGNNEDIVQDNQDKNNNNIGEIIETAGAIGSTALGIAATAQNIAKGTVSGEAIELAALAGETIGNQDLNNENSQVEINKDTENNADNSQDLFESDTDINMTEDFEEQELPDFIEDSNENTDFDFGDNNDGIDQPENIDLDFKPNDIDINEENQLSTETDSLGNYNEPDTAEQEFDINEDTDSDFSDFEKEMELQAAEDFIEDNTETTQPDKIKSDQDSNSNIYDDISEETLTDKDKIINGMTDISIDKDLQIEGNNFEGIIEDESISADFENNIETKDDEQMPELTDDIVTTEEVTENTENENLLPDDSIQNESVNNDLLEEKTQEDLEINLDQDDNLLIDFEELEDNSNLNDHNEPIEEQDENVISLNEIEESELPNENIKTDDEELKSIDTINLDMEDSTLVLPDYQTDKTTSSENVFDFDQIPSETEEPQAEDVNYELINLSEIEGNSTEDISNAEVSFADNEPPNFEDIPLSFENSETDYASIEDLDLNSAEITPINTVKENSTIITDKNQNPGEIIIDINKNDSELDLSGENQHLEELYNNDVLDGNSGLDNDVRVVNEKGKSVPVVALAGGLTVFIILAGLIIFSIAKFMTPQQNTNNEMAGNMDIQNNMGGNVPEMNINNNGIAMNNTNQDFGRRNNPQQSPAIQQNQNNLKQIPDTAFMSVRKLSWEVPDYISFDGNFKQYFQSAGKSLKAALSSDLLLATDYAYSDQIRISVTYDRSGALKNTKLLLSSGSSQVDNIVLQSVNQTLKVLKAPNSVGNDESTTVILKIYL